MRTALRCTLTAVVLSLAPTWCIAQDLTPRAYAAVPVSSNAVIVTYAFSDGELLFDPTLPIENATGTIHTPVLTGFHSFRLFDRVASITGSMPFAYGDFNGTVLGADRSVHRQGFADVSVRIAVNLLGARALVPAVFIKTPPSRATLGASLKVIAPTGQYDPTLLINIGSNRWSFKPELGYSRRVGPLLLDGYAGIWLLTANNDFFATVPGAPKKVRTQDPIGAFEFHVSYDVRPRLWISADVNYWRGGRSSVDGERNERTLQANSRLGVTGSVPLTRHQSFKVSYSDGWIVRIGGNYKILSIGWQYSWLGMSIR
jgi:hypothetical protein